MSDNAPLNMETAIQKAGVLLEALPHIQRFQPDTVIVPLGPSSLNNPQLVRRPL